MFTHLEPDGDAIGSSLALYFFLKSLGKDVRFIKPYRTPNSVVDFPGMENVYSGNDFDFSRVAILLDASSLKRIGKPYEEIFPRYKNFFIIDHHHGPYFDSTNIYVDITASATAVLVFDIIKKMKHDINNLVATYLYLALHYDTGGFYYTNTNKKCLKVASKLLEYGADMGLVMKYYERDASSISKMGFLLSKLKASEGISWLPISYKDFVNFSLEPDITKGLIEWLRRIKDCRVSIVFREDQPGKVKISFRGKNTGKLNSIAEHFGGGGHPEASGAVVEGNFDEVVELVLNYTKKEVFGD
ncbi:DHH family phosphoesterase [Thermodesulfobium narugense]|uniref:DHH family phosphoesterase n=1 Tax=Thermodesulfobium narugense TaxID=184064 RepID=UPI0024789AAF|nr:DHH family phosphoesterase [Thermodesulfobium narugense]